MERGQERFGGGKGTTNSHYSLLFTRNSVEPTRHGTLDVSCIREGRRPKGPARKNEALVKNVALSARREHARRDTKSGEAAEIFLRIRFLRFFYVRGCRSSNYYRCTNLTVSLYCVGVLRTLNTVILMAWYRECKRGILLLEGKQFLFDVSFILKRCSSLSSYRYDND